MGQFNLCDLIKRKCKKHVAIFKLRREDNFQSFDILSVIS